MCLSWPGSIYCPCSIYFFLCSGRSQLPLAVLSLIATPRRCHVSLYIPLSGSERGPTLLLVSSLQGHMWSLEKTLPPQHLLARDLYPLRGGLQPFSPAGLFSRWEPAGLEGSLRVLRAGEASLPQTLLSLCTWVRLWPGASPPPWRMESTVTLLVVCFLPGELQCPRQRKLNPQTPKGSPNVQK